MYVKVSLKISKFVVDNVYDHILQTLGHNMDKEDNSEFHPIYNNGDNYFKILMEDTRIY